jgi:tRNA nucleotidyltransferase (CCA-adding enzyme)
VTPLINGNQLKALGYKPGPGFRAMLQGLLAAQIDGLIQTEAEAMTFITTHYPLEEQPLAAENVKIV